jgi:hypothetical protein
VGRVDALGQIDAEEGRLVGGPARSRILQHAHIVEGALLRIERGILPPGHHQGVADVVGVGCLFDIHGVADGFVTAVLVVDRPVVRAQHVVDLLVQLALAEATRAGRDIERFIAPP